MEEIVRELQKISEILLQNQTPVWLTYLSSLGPLILTGNADGSLFKKGERIWLENLDGYADLRGLTITALGENGESIWTASVPNEDENNGFTHLVNDDWEITNIE